MLQAIHKALVIKPILKEKKHGGRIIIPETKGARMYHSSYYGIVMSISEQSRWKDELKIGDKIIYRRHEGKKVRDDGELFLVMRDEWVLARLEE